MTTVREHAVVVVGAGRPGWLPPQPCDGWDPC